MERQAWMMVFLAAFVVALGIYLAVKGNPGMIRERFASGVSSENERKFMITIGGGVSIIGIDMMILAILDGIEPLSKRQILVIMGIGVVLFGIVIAYGQKKYRRSK